MNEAAVSGKTGTHKPVIRKLGTIDCDIVETTPIVFNDRLYRFEYIRKRYYANNTGDSYFRFVDVETGNVTALFGRGYHLGSAFADNDTMFVFGVDQWGGKEIRTFFSKDMINWESYVNISLPGFRIYNNSVCKNADDKYIMLIELASPPEENWVNFTPRFLGSDDLFNWRLLPLQYIFGKDFYTGGHFLIFEGGYYYLTYLHAHNNREYYETYIVRSKDIIKWESSSLNPFMTFSEEDRIISNHGLPKVQLPRISMAESLNSSDQEFCEFRGKTVIYYSWGNQTGIEFLAEAVYEGSVKSLVEGFFPLSNNTRRR